MPYRFSKQYIQKGTLYLSVGLFVISLSREVFCTNNDCSGDWSGLAILFSGTFGFFLSPAGFVWLANPLLFFSWRYIKRDPKNTLITSIASSILAISFLFFKRIVADEAGSYYHITGYRIGYWLWLTSVITMLVGNLLVKFGKYSDVTS